MSTETKRKKKVRKERIKRAEFLGLPTPNDFNHDSRNKINLTNDSRVNG
jgi:hypothetical protein